MASILSWFSKLIVLFLMHSILQFKIYVYIDVILITFLWWFRYLCSTRLLPKSNGEIFQSLINSSILYWLTEWHIYLK